MRREYQVVRGRLSTREVLAVCGLPCSDLAAAESALDGIRHTQEELPYKDDHDIGYWIEEVGA